MLYDELMVTKPKPVATTETPIYDALTQEYGDPHIPPISLVLPPFNASPSRLARRKANGTGSAREAAAKVKAPAANGTAHGSGKGEAARAVGAPGDEDPAARA